MKLDPERVRECVRTFDGNWRVLNCEIKIIFGNCSSQEQLWSLEIQRQEQVIAFLCTVKVSC